MTASAWISAMAVALAIFAGCPQHLQASEEGAKGLFFEQLDNPGQKLNTGIQYWIELQREGKFLKVNNKYPFRSGDRIRFHVKANIDGYAYVLLSSGSRGEQSVLFPEPHEDNKIVRGKDYALPSDGFLTFDEHPGVEKVSLVVSRLPMDATAYLRERNEQERTLVASAAPGSKDLIPSKILLSYTPPPAPAASPANATPGARPAAAGAARAEPPPQARLAEPSKGNGKAKPASLAVQTGKEKPAAEPPVQPRRKRSPRQKIVVAGGSAGKPAVAAKPAASKPTLENDAGVVTVVFNDPSGVLSLEVDLEHI
jgi:hypothetical protein